MAVWGYAAHQGTLVHLKHLQPGMPETTGFRLLSCRSLRSSWLPGAVINTESRPYDIYECFLASPSLQRVGHVKIVDKLQARHAV